MNIRQRNGNKARQGGFTLLEMVIAISILSIMMAAVVLSYDGSKSRGMILVTSMDEYGGAMQRMKADTACYPRSLVALLDRAFVAQGADSFCGSPLTSQWNGPYIKPVPFDGPNKKLLLKAIAPDVTLTVSRVSVPSGNDVFCHYYIVADEVPNDIATQATMSCNSTGNDEQTGDSQTKRCPDEAAGVQTAASSGSAERSKVYYLFDRARVKSAAQCAA